MYPKNFFRRVASAVASLLLPFLDHPGITCIAILAGYCVVGFWPFTLSFRNHVHWISGKSGIQFEEPSILDSGKSIDFSKVNAESGHSGSMSLELLTSPYTQSERDTYPILSLYDGALPENLYLGQWKSHLLMRTPVVDPSGKRRYHETTVINALRQSKQRFVAITFGPDGTSIYVDGTITKTDAELVLPGEFLSGRLLLGSNPRGGSGWYGKLFGLAIFRRTLGADEVLRHYRIWTSHHSQEIEFEPGLSGLFFFDEGSGSRVRDHSSQGNDLLAPQYYRPLRKTILPWDPLRFDASYVFDVTINILGFAPFGFFFFVYLSKAGRVPSPSGRGWRPRSASPTGRSLNRSPGEGPPLIRRFAPPSPGGRRALPQIAAYLRHLWFKIRSAPVPLNACLTVLVAGAVSAAIELTQVFLPTRSSSIPDLICNMTGAMLGVFVAIAFRNVIPRS